MTSIDFNLIKLNLKINLEKTPKISQTNNFSKEKNNNFLNNLNKIKPTLKKSKHKINQINKTEIINFLFSFKKKKKNFISYIS
jgi:hypothetical protein